MKKTESNKNNVECEILNKMKNEQKINKLVKIDEY